MVGRIAIVGAGQAGARTAQALRTAGYSGTISLIGDEPHPPYERPPLSKGFLTDTEAPVQAHVLPGDFYTQHAIQLLTPCRVAEINLDVNRLRFDSGETLAFDTLLFATGSRARTLAVPGNHLPGIYYLRSLDEALSLRQALAHAKRIVVIGGGFLGLEVAASARTLGLDVVVLERETCLLARVVPNAIGELVAQLHRNHGVQIQCCAQVKRIEGSVRATGVTLVSGETIAADVVLVAIGGVPNAELGASAGLAVADGIVVDQHGRTDAENVYAVGDVSCHPNFWAQRHVRLESWQVAQNQSVAVAASICGEPREYNEVPWFWSDQFGVNIQIAGLPRDDDEAVYRGAPDVNNLTVFYFRQRRLVGSIAFNNGLNIRIAQRLITQRADIDPAKLAAVETPLKSLLAS